MEHHGGHNTHVEDSRTSNPGVDIGHNEEQHGDEKKSVMQKVKDKAKKFKETIKDHVGHGHDHDDNDNEGNEADMENHDTHRHSPGQEGFARPHTHEPILKERIVGEGAQVMNKHGDHQTSDAMGRPKEYEEQPYAPKNTPTDMHAGGHSSDLDTGKKGAHVKLGSVGVDKDPQAPGEDRHPTNYQAKVTDPIATGHDSTTDQNFTFMPGMHESNMGERTSMQGVINTPARKLQDDYHTFDPMTTSHVPGQEENIGGSRTDTGRQNESEELFNASNNIPIAAHSGYDSTGLMPGQHRSNVGEGVNHSPESNLQGHYQTFNPNPTSYVPGQEETLGWSRTDTGIRNEFDESKVTDPTGKGGEEIGVTPILHQLDNMNIRDEPEPKPSTDQQERSQFKTQHNPRDQNILTGSHDQFSPEPVSYETRKGEPVSDETRKFLESTGTSDQKQGSYTEKISSTAAMMADKAKQAASSVTSKLGYGGSSDQYSTAASSGKHDKPSQQGGYGEKLSSVTTAVTGKAVQAKDGVAAKLGYGVKNEGQQPLQEGASKGESIIGGGNDKMATDGPTTGNDKGVTVMEYLAEKLKPGEEDKALSEVISESLPLPKRKEDVSKVGEEGQGEEGKVKIIGRVTESEEVAKRLGRSQDTNYDDAGAGMASPGKGVVGRIKEAATVWFQKGVEVPSQNIEGNESRNASLESEEKRTGEPVPE